MASDPFEELLNLIEAAEYPSEGDVRPARERFQSVVDQWKARHFTAGPLREQLHGCIAEISYDSMLDDQLLLLSHDPDAIRKHADYIARDALARAIVQNDEVIEKTDFGFHPSRGYLTRYTIKLLKKR